MVKGGCVEENSTSPLSHAAIFAPHKVSVVIFSQFFSQTVKHHRSWKRLTFPFGWLAKEARDQAIPLSLARDPDAKHLSDNWEQVRDKNDKEAKCDGYLCFFRSLFIGTSSDFELLPIIVKFEAVAQKKDYEGEHCQEEGGQERVTLLIVVLVEVNVEVADDERPGDDEGKEES